MRYTSPLCPILIAPFLGREWAGQKNLHFFWGCAVVVFAQLPTLYISLTEMWIVHFIGGQRVLGFFTKFGDGACDLAPLSGLVKNQVRAIARSFGAPESLVEKVPTADLEDLEPGKPDEASHGVTYQQIDAFLHGQPVDQAAFDIIVATYRKTQHKRELPFAP